jgi:entericidin B
MMPMIRNLMLVLLMALGVTAAACNTVRGAGEDLESAANTVDNGM